MSDRIKALEEALLIGVNQYREERMVNSAFYDAAIGALNLKPQPEVEIDQEPVAWVIPGDGLKVRDGFIDAMAYPCGKFTRPLYGAPTTVQEAARVPEIAAVIGSAERLIDLYEEAGRPLGRSERKLQEALRAIEVTHDKD